MSTTRYAVKSGSRTSLANTREAIRNRHEFKTSGALRGEAFDQPYDTPDSWAGYLPKTHLPAWLKWHDRIDYVVYSYSTPIAWHLSTPNEYGVEWIVPEVSYSVTTAAHQSVVRLALGTDW